MNPDQLKDIIANLNIWKKGDQRAPHKPLLILYALARLKSGQKGLLSYEEVKDPLKQLLIDFGPFRTSYHPEEPFVRLYRDGIWKLNKERDEVKVDNKWLLNNHIAGGFSNEVTDLLLNNKYLLREVAELVLDGHFTESMHEDILTAVGLDFEYESSCEFDYSVKKVKKRDPQFRGRVLSAYEYRCAVCGFNVRLGHQLVGIEAAHIKWHQYGGPDKEDNGVALCSIHHKLYDYGVFTISPSKQVIVSQKAYGTSGFDEWLMRYHGQRIRNPVDKCYYPEDEYIAWNVREVFKGKGRSLL